MTSSSRDSIAPAPMHRTAREPGRAGLAVVLAALVAASMSYGVTLPLLPFMLERLPGAMNADSVSWHVGVLTGLYTFALFLLSPLWGSLADRRGSRAVLAVGLVGAGASLLLLDAANSLTALYAVRFFSGMLSAAVLPAGLAYVAEMTAPAQRTRNFSIATAATTLGFLLGPVVGSALASMVIAPIVPMRIAGVFMPDSPFFATGMLCIVIGLACLTLHRRETAVDPSMAGVRGAMDLRRIGICLLLTALVVYGISAGEVGVTLLGKARSIGPQGVSRLFVVCGVVMIAVQVMGLPKLVGRFDARWVLALAFLAGALALIRLPWAGGIGAMSLSFAVLGTSIGVLIPALATLISQSAGAAQGKAMGWQAASANLGQAVAATATGGLFAVDQPLPFMVAAGLLGTGAAVAALLKNPAAAA